MKTTRLLSGMCTLGIMLLAGCFFPANYHSQYAQTADGDIYEVDPYYNDMTQWVNCDAAQREQIRVVLVETRNQVIVDRRNAHSDSEFHRLAGQRYDAANTRISHIFTPEQNRAFQPHRTEFRNWVHGQRERPQQQQPPHGQPNGHEGNPHEGRGH